MNEAHKVEDVWSEPGQKVEESCSHIIHPHSLLPFPLFPPCSSLPPLSILFTCLK